MCAVRSQVIQILSAWDIWYGAYFNYVLVISDCLVPEYILSTYTHLATASRSCTWIKCTGLWSILGWWVILIVNWLEVRISMGTKLVECLWGTYCIGFRFEDEILSLNTVGCSMAWGPSPHKGKGRWTQHSSVCCWLQCDQSLHGFPLWWSVFMNCEPS